MITVSTDFYLIILDRKLTKAQKEEINSNSSFGLAFEDKAVPPKDVDGSPIYGVAKNKVTHIYHDKYEDVSELVSSIKQYFSL